MSLRLRLSASQALSTSEGCSRLAGSGSACAPASHWTSNVACAACRLWLAGPSIGLA